MVKCYYCDYEYEIVSDFHKHLNDKHTKCMNCGKVFDNTQDDYALCDECAKEDIDLTLAFGISSDKYYLPINDNNSRFDLVEIKTTHPNVQPTPHCKIHGAMNVVGVFENGKLWRCLQSKALKDCRAGCEEKYE